MVKMEEAEEEEGKEEEEAAMMSMDEREKMLKVEIEEGQMDS
jgi:hypothetical protein